MSNAAARNAANSVSLIIAVERNATQGDMAVSTTITVASRRDAPSRRNSSQERPSHANVAINGTSRSQGKFAGKDGYKRQATETSHGNRIGYFVCGGSPGMLMIRYP